MERKDRITKTFCNHVTRLDKYFRYLEQEGYIFLSSLRHFSLPKYEKKHHPILSRTEMERILRSIPGESSLCVKGRAIIVLGYSSALRPQELYSLKIADIDFDKGLIFIEQSLNRKDRIVPVGQKLWSGPRDTSKRYAIIMSKTIRTASFSSTTTREKD